MGWEWTFQQWLYEFWLLLVMVAVPALILYVANELWYRACGVFGRRTELITGLIGTPVHEISHAFMAKLFRMSVRDIALYKPDPQSRTLGYVVYAYQPGSIWHGLGRFVVGIAPLIGGALAVTGLLWLADLPLLKTYLDGSSLEAASFLRWAGDLASATDNLKAVAALTVAVMIATHATPSTADMKGSVSGFLGTLSVFVLFKVGLMLLPAAAYQRLAEYVDLTAFVTAIAGQVLQLAMIGALAAALLSVVVWLMAAVAGRFKKARV